MTFICATSSKITELIESLNLDQLDYLLSLLYCIRFYGELAGWDTSTRLRLDWRGKYYTGQINKLEGG